MKDVSYRRTTRIGRDIVAWLDYLDVHDYADRTKDNYERDVARMALLHPDTPLNKYADPEIYASLKTYPAPSRKRARASISAFFDWATRTRRIRHNPMQWVDKMRPQPRKRFAIFTPGEVDQLLALPADDAVLMAILFGFGIRKQEATGLQVRQLKVAEQPAYIQIVKGKGNKDRDTYGLPDKAEIVREYLLHHQLEPTDHLWYLRPGGSSRRIIRNRRMGDVTCHGWWHRCLDDAGVRVGAGPRERNMHLTRHTYATEWLRRGGRLEVLSRNLGHKSIETTYNLYAHLDQRDVLVDLAAISETPL